MSSTEVTERQLKIVAQLVKLDVPRLYEIIGMQTLGLEDPLEVQSRRGITDFSLSFTSARLRGKRFFEGRRVQLKEAICQRWKYCEKADQYEGDFEKLMTALIPVILSALGQPLTGLAVAISALVFKYGLRNLCECK
jgi:hypothetical protein